MLRLSSPTPGQLADTAFRERAQALPRKLGLLREKVLQLA
jgi:hypothetical protein